MKFFTAAALAAASLTVASQSDAATLRLDGFTSAVASVQINAYPGTPAGTNVGASGFNITDTSGSMGSFVAWCLDAGHWLMGVGESQNYNVTSSPWSNSYGLEGYAVARVQAVFDANYGTLDLSDKASAGGFQMALWEAAFEGVLPLNLADGLFQAASTDAIAKAIEFLGAASTYSGPQKYLLTFLEVDNDDPQRSSSTGQNLVTVTELPQVPVPAGGVLLFSALAGIGLVRRRRG